MQQLTCFSKRGTACAAQHQKNPPSYQPVHALQIRGYVSKREFGSSWHQMPGAMKCMLQSLRFGDNASFCGKARNFLPSETCISGSGKLWQVHTPPIHTPTNCQPNFLPHLPRHLCVDRPIDSSIMANHSKKN